MDRPDTSREVLKRLNQMDLVTQAYVKDMYNQINDLLKELILDDTHLNKAYKKLADEWDRIVLAEDFKGELTRLTTSIIVDSSYVKPALHDTTKKAYKEALLRSRLWKDNVQLSSRIRLNNTLIVSKQKRLLKQTLKEGRSVVQMTKELADTGFKTEIPEYINKLKKTKLAGKKIKPESISAARKKAQSLQTASLKRSYTELIDAIDIGENINEALEDALYQKAKSLSRRLAQTETINATSEVRTDIELSNPRKNQVKSITTGPRPCPICLTIESFEWMNVESGMIPPHHPNCSCTAVFRVSDTLKKETNKDFYQRFDRKFKKIEGRKPYNSERKVKVSNLRNKKTFAEKLNLKK